MEWMLQVVDEIDDAVAIVRQGWLGAHAHIGMLAGGLATATALAIAASFKLRLSIHRPRP
jgi:hypothetical protein